MDKKLFFNTSTCIRVLISLILTYFIFKEAGIVTAISILFINLGSELDLIEKKIQRKNDKIFRDYLMGKS